MAINPFDFFVPVPRPEGPKNKVGPIGAGEEREPIDSSMLPYPVASLNVIRVGIFGKSRRFRLLRCKETLLLLRNLEQASGCITVGLSHDTILQNYCGSVKTAGAFVRNQAAMPNTMPSFRHAKLKTFDTVNH